MLTNEIHATLKYFNEKSNKIINSEYVKNLDNGKVSLSLKRDGYVVTNPEVTVPNDVYIESLILSLRFFIQDNEDISIRNLYKIYNNHNIDQSFRNRFNEARNWLINYLDCKCIVKQEGLNLTRLQVFEYFVYGEYAHATKKEEFDKLKYRNIFYGIYRYVFNEILIMYIKTIREIVNINQELLEKCDI